MIVGLCPCYALLCEANNFPLQTASQPWFLGQWLGKVSMNRRDLFVNCKIVRVEGAISVMKNQKGSFHKICNADSSCCIERGNQICTDGNWSCSSSFDAIICTFCYSSANLLLLCRHFSPKISENHDDFTVNHLIHSCGLSKKVQFQHPRWSSCVLQKDQASFCPFSETIDSLKSRSRRPSRIAQKFSNSIMRKPFCRIARLVVGFTS